MDNNSKSKSHLDTAPTLRAEKVLRAAVQERRLTKEYLLSEEFRETRSLFLEHAANGSFPNYWSAVSALGRAASVSKPAEAELRPIIAQMLSHPFNEVARLSDGEDRYYLARSFDIAPGALDLGRAAAEIVQEEAAEKARALWIKIAIAASSSKSALLQAINLQLGQLSLAEQFTTDFLLKRLRRIGAALFEPLIIADIPAGDDFANEFRRFYTGHFQGKGPEDRQALESLALEIVEAANRIIHFSFAAATDPAIYLIGFDLRQWWRPSSPSVKFDLAARALAKTGVEILHIFARQGIRNKPLRDALERCAGAEALTSLAISISNTDKSLDEVVAHWFVTGGELDRRRTTEGIEQLNSTNLDEYVGRLLLAATTPELNARTLMAAAERIADLQPDDASIISGAASRIGQMTQWARAVARLRCLEVVGERGNLVSYDPAVHAGPDTLHIGAKVRMATPSVIKTEPSRPSIQIIKAEVTI